MNKLEIIGKLNWFECKFLDSGKIILRALVSEKQKEEWVSFPVTLFNSHGKDVIEEFANKAKKGDYVRFVGKLGMDKFKTKTGDEVERISINAFEAEFVKYDEKTKRFVRIEKENCVENEKFATAEQTVDEEIPF